MILMKNQKKKIQIATFPLNISKQQLIQMKPKKLKLLLLKNKQESQEKLKTAIMTMKMKIMIVLKNLLLMMIQNTVNLVKRKSKRKKK